MERYRKNGSEATVQAIQLNELNSDEIAMLVPGAQIVEEVDPFTREASKGFNIPTADGMQRLSQGQYLVQYGGNNFGVMMPTRFRLSFTPIEIPPGVVPRDVRDEKILRAHQDET